MDKNKIQDRIRGSLIGGAIGDALGYPVEFLQEEQIFRKYGENGITAYTKDAVTGKALISDDTQMSLFTANGLLVGDTRGAMRGIRGWPRGYVMRAYKDWLKTQESTLQEVSKMNVLRHLEAVPGCWMCRSCIPEELRATHVCLLCRMVQNTRIM